jgi:protein phosphatase
MADQWYYSQAGQVRGPVSTDRVQQLLASGEIKPEEEVWAGNSDRKQASEVRKASTLRPAPAAPVVPDWLEDVAKVEQAAQAEGSSAVEIDWLADVEIPPGPVNVEPAGQAVPAAEAGVVEVIPFLEAAVVVPPAPRVQGPSRLLVGGATSRGMVRDRNEDHFLVQHLVWSDGEDWHEVAALVVCDGMGGHKAGDRASSLAVRSFATTLAPVLAGILQNPSRDAGAAVLARHLDKAFQDAHSAICRRAETEAACKGMGSTAAVVVVWDDQAFIRHVGDCRVYQLEAGKFQQVTKDQTLVARMVELGQLTPEEALKHPARNEVTQALGKRGVVDPSQESALLEPGDRLVVACDGLGAHVQDSVLAEIVTSWKGTAVDLAAHLVDLANEGGGSDNCTVVTLFYG